MQQLHFLGHSSFQIDESSLASFRCLALRSTCAGTSGVVWHLLDPYFINYLLSLAGLVTRLFMSKLGIGRLVKHLRVYPTKRWYAGHFLRQTVAATAAPSTERGGRVCVARAPVSVLARLVSVVVAGLRARTRGLSLYQKCVGFMIMPWPGLRDLVWLKLGSEAGGYLTRSAELRWC